MKTSDLVAWIEHHAPLNLQAPWDHSGVQVASVRDSFSHLAICLDLTPDSLQRAIDLGCDAVLSHHPLSLSPTLPNVCNSYHTVLRLAMRNDLLLYAAHTSLDANSNGSVSWLARRLDLQNVEVLDPYPSHPEKGFGLVGDLPAPRQSYALLNELAHIVSAPESMLIGKLPDEIRRIAYCTGSGQSCIAAAFAAHADLYITGDIKYHAALDSPLAILDVGHHSLEEAMMAMLCEEMRQERSDMTISFLPSASPYTLLDALLSSTPLHEHV